MRDADFQLAMELLTRVRNLFSGSRYNREVVSFVSSQGTRAHREREILLHERGTAASTEGNVKKESQKQFFSVYLSCCSFFPSTTSTSILYFLTKNSFDSIGAVGGLATALLVVPMGEI